MWARFLLTLFLKRLQLHLMFEHYYFYLLSFFKKSHKGKKSHTGKRGREQGIGCGGFLVGGFCPLLPFF